jgi:starch synthase
MSKKMKKAKVLFVSQEITPYLDETYISKLSRKLPQGIQEKGREIRTFMPRYGSVNERRNQLHEVIRLSGINIIINDTDQPLIIKVASIQSARMQVYFIDNEEYFNRKTILHDTNGNMHTDNDERSIFFNRGVLETVKKLGWQPDIIHCHGWFTAPMALYIKKAFKDDPMFADTKVVYSIYDDAYTGALDKDFSKKIKLEGITDKDVAVAKDATYANLTKLAIDFADGVIIGSETIDPEVQKYLKTANKPVLPFKTEGEYVDAYNTFYDEVLMEESVLA